MEDLDPPLPRPTFKKRAKVENKRARIRPVEDVDVAVEVSTQEIAARRDTLKAAKWARYLALGNLSQAERPASKAGQLEAEDTVTVHESTTLPEASEGLPEPRSLSLDDDAVVLDSTVTFSGENKAFQVMQPSSNTFLLGTSHFRDAGPTLSLENEYADAYGNVLDEDLNRAKPDELDDPDDDHYNVARSPVLSNSEMYDLELSVDEDTEPRGTTSTVPTLTDILSSLSEELKKLHLEIDVQKTQQQRLQEQLDTLQQDRATLILSFQ